MEDVVESLEDYFKRSVKEGLFSEDGCPMKCGCGCTDFKEVEKYYGDVYIEEYALQCTNEECLSIVGRWSYGTWVL